MPASAQAHKVCFRARPRSIPGAKSRGGRMDGRAWLTQTSQREEVIQRMVYTLVIEELEAKIAPIGISQGGQRGGGG